MEQLNEHAQESFKTLISRYSEDNYFFLVRNYLGLVSTPFHKPQLTGRLCTFFCQKHIQENMLAMLDEMDLVILSLIQVTGSVRTEDVTRLLKSRWSYGTLLRRVSNLQQRMVLLNNNGYLVCNPLIEEQLSERTSLTPLFGEHAHACRNTPYCSTEFLRSFLSLIRKEGKIAFREEYQRHFPTFAPEPLEQLFNALGRALLSLSVLEGEKHVQINDQKACALLTLNDRQLLCLLLCHQLGLENMEFAFDLLVVLGRIGSLDTNSLKLLIGSLAVKHHLESAPSLLSELSTWGVISLDEGWHVSALDTDHPHSGLLVDSDQTISYEGTCPPDDMLYRIAEIEVLDHQKRYRVTKESFVLALDSGLAFDEIEHYLHTTSRSSSATTLLKQLRLLHERYRRIAIYDALILSCDERTANLLTNLPSLKEHVLSSLTPTVFLMRRDTEELWRQILVDSGQLLGSTKRHEHIEVKRPVENPLFTQMLANARTCTEPSLPSLVGPKPSAFLDNRLLEAIQTAKLTDEQRSDLEHRYHARMILTKEQIVAQVLNTVLEAGGFDYQGKVSLCRQASGKTNIALELQLTDQELVVQALEVAYTPQKEALLKAAVMPTMEVKIIPVSKIFLVRLVRIHLA
jgi:hypothetical protein